MARLWGCGTGTCQTIWLVVVSIASTWSVPKPATRTRLPSGVMARPCGVVPTSILEATSSVMVLMTDTTESPSLLAYTHLLSGVITSPCGPVGMGIVLVTWLRAVSITPMALSPNRPTYTFGAALAAYWAAASGLAPVASAATAANEAPMVAIRVARRER